MLHLQYLLYIAKYCVAYDVTIQQQQQQQLKHCTKKNEKTEIEIIETHSLQNEIFASRKATGGQNSTQKKAISKEKKISVKSKQRQRKKKYNPNNLRRNFLMKCPSNDTQKSMIITTERETKVIQSRQTHRRPM